MTSCKVDIKIRAMATNSDLMALRWLQEPEYRAGICEGDKSVPDFDAIENLYSPIASPCATPTTGALVKATAR